jgi:hypothetical protein
MMYWVHVTQMNNLDTALRRILINGLFGSGILLILVLAVVFRYYIDKQNNLNMDELNQIVEEEITKNEY